MATSTGTGSTSDADLPVITKMSMTEMAAARDSPDGPTTAQLTYIKDHGIPELISKRSRSEQPPEEKDFVCRMVFFLIKDTLARMKKIDKKLNDCKGDLTLARHASRDEDGNVVPSAVETHVYIREDIATLLERLKKEFQYTHKYLEWKCFDLDHCLSDDRLQAAQMIGEAGRLYETLTCQSRE